MKRITDFQSMCAKGEKIAALTAYDASFAHILADNGVDLILVGDSLGMVIHGASDTLAVTLDEMVYHTKHVARGASKPLIMADLPFGTYGSPSKAFESAVLLVKAGAAVIKIEGGDWLAETIAYLHQHGIPVCAHIGLTGQMVHTMGGFKIQGRDLHAIDALVNTALVLEQAGAAMLLLECVSLAATERLMAAVNIPVIGIGAGPQTDGQILVTYDVLGITPHKPYKFVKNFLNTDAPTISEAIQAYVTAVKTQTFPTWEHSFECK